MQVIKQEVMGVPGEDWKSAQRYEGGPGNHNGDPVQVRGRDDAGACMGVQRGQEEGYSMMHRKGRWLTRVQVPCWFPH